MDRKTALIGGVMLGIGIYSIPIFVDIGVGTLALKITGGLVMVAGVVYFVAYDVFSGAGKQNKELKRKIKSGEITPEQAYELEMKQLDIELERQKKLAEIEKKKAQIKKMKGGGINLGGDGGFKMPDVLGNIGGVVSGPKQDVRTQQQQDMFSNLGSIISPQKPAAKKTKKKPKQKDFWY